MRSFLTTTLTQIIVLLLYGTWGAILPLVFPSLGPVMLRNDEASVYVDLLAYLLLFVPLFGTVRMFGPFFPTSKEGVDIRMARCSALLLIAPLHLITIQYLFAAIRHEQWLMALVFGVIVFFVANIGGRVLAIFRQSIGQPASETEMESAGCKAIAISSMGIGFLMGNSLAARVLLSQWPWILKLPVALVLAWVGSILLAFILGAAMTVPLGIAVHRKKKLAAKLTSTPDFLPLLN
jgi:hypothetical protein